MIKYFIILLLLFLFIMFFILSKKISPKSIYFLHIMSIIFFSILIGSYFYLEKKENRSNYNPPVFDGEKVIPGYFDEKD